MNKINYENVEEVQHSIERGIEEVKDNLDNVTEEEIKEALKIELSYYN